jgi:hypothetical protein
MAQKDTQTRPRLTRLTFAERLCGDHGKSEAFYEVLAWRYGASWPTRALRPLIVYLAPRYFDAEDFHLARASECRWRDEIAEEMHLMRASYLRRGGWRFFGIGLNGARLLRYFDDLVTVEVIEKEASRAAGGEQRGRSAMPMDKQSF